MTGPGAPVLLLPGFMCDARLWRHQAAALKDVGDPMVADLSTHDSIAAMARDALDQVEGRFALAGFSMGGIVALEMWRQAPARVERLLLLDTNARADSPERKAQREAQMARVGQGALADVVIEELKPAYLAPGTQGDHALRAEIVAMALDLGEQVFARQSVALRDRRDSADTLATITCPTLVAYGAEDELCPRAFHEFMAERIAGSTLAAIAGAGHLPPLEQPARLTALMRRWLADA